MTNPVAIELPIAELVKVAADANVFKIMSENKTNTVTIDYVPARAAMLIPRDETDAPLESYPLNPIPITFRLEDAMFAGQVFVALTVGHRVIVHPFQWRSFDELAKITLK